MMAECSDPGSSTGPPSCARGLPHLLLLPGRCRGSGRSKPGEIRRARDTDGPLCLRGEQHCLSCTGEDTEAQRGDVAAEATRSGSGKTRLPGCKPVTEQEGPGKGAVQGRKGNYALRTATHTLLKTTCEPAFASVCRTDGAGSGCWGADLAGVSSSHPRFQTPRVLPVNKQRRRVPATHSSDWAGVGRPTPSSVPSISPPGKTLPAWSQMTGFQEE